MLPLWRSFIIESQWKITAIGDTSNENYCNLIITSHLEVFKSLQKTLIKHITQEYTGRGEVIVFCSNSLEWDLSTIDAHIKDPKNYNL